MIRKIITIDREKCNGCGLCAKACHEGAIGIQDGKAVLLREDYCDGLGDCLPACPQNAIAFEHREAAPYNEAAVLEAKEKASQLKNFPVQLKLVPTKAPWYNNCDLLIAADCCAYCHENFHKQFMNSKITLIGCPKLDGVNYAQKLSAIFSENNISHITVARMTVPCCGGLPFAVEKALEISGKQIPVQIVTLSPDGKIIH